MARLVLGLLAFISLVLLSGSQVDGRDKDDVVKVDARTLLGDYTKDEKAADQKYKGKVLQVEGVVKGSFTDISGVHLEGGTEAKATVQCKFGSAEMKTIRYHNRAALSTENKGKNIKRIEKGANVVIKGTCNGITGTARRKAVVLENCEVIDPVLLK
jgi:hypothetical protein